MFIDRLDDVFVKLHVVSVYKVSWQPQEIQF